MTPAKGGGGLSRQLGWTGASRGLGFKSRNVAYACSTLIFLSDYVVYLALLHQLTWRPNLEVFGGVQTETSQKPGMRKRSRL